MKSYLNLIDWSVSSVLDSRGMKSQSGDVSHLEIWNRIFKDVAQQMNELGSGSPKGQEFCPALPPDIIVISDDQSLLFEAQNAWALELLARICGFARETMTLSERVRVHHCRSRQIIDQLTAAGATVSGEFR